MLTSDSLHSSTAARLWKGSLLLCFCALICQVFLTQRRITSWLARVYGEFEVHAAHSEIPPEIIWIPTSPDVVAASAVKKGIVLNQTSGERSPLDNCNVTAQVKIITSAPFWTLQTLDAAGNEKSVGGDELYVYYTDKNQLNKTKSRTESFDPTAVALIEDKRDGTYVLDFVTTPANPTPTDLLGIGVLTVHFQYSCGIGRMPPPTKHLWKDRGSTFVTHEAHDVLAPPVRSFRAPSNGIDFNQHNLTLFFGDSLMQSLVEQDRHFYLPGRVYTQWNVATELATRTVAEFMRDLDEWHRNELHKTTTGLVLGSAVWDILQPENTEQGMLFEDHLLACRQLIDNVRNKYPNVTIYWKSPSAMHIHRLPPLCDKKCTDRTRYMSTSRAFYLYQKQKELMLELGVPFLDLYEAYYLSGGRTIYGDGRHYDHKLSQMILRWFFPSLFAA